MISHPCCLSLHSNNITYLKKEEIKYRESIVAHLACLYHVTGSYQGSYKTNNTPALVSQHLLSANVSSDHLAMLDMSQDLHSLPPVQCHHHVLQRVQGGQVHLAIHLSQGQAAPPLHLHCHPPRVHCPNI